MNIFLYVITVLIWGSTWYAITFQFGVVPLEWSVAYRFILASLILFAFCKLTGRDLRFPLHQHLLFLALGFFLFSGNYYLTYISTSYIPSGLVAVTFSLLTIMNIINAHFFLKKPISIEVMIGAAIGVMGIGLVFLPEIEHVHIGDEAFFGLGIAISAAYLASLGNTLAGSGKMKDLRIFPMNAWGMFYGAMILSLVAIGSGKMPVYDTSLSFNLSFLFLTIFGSVIAFTAYLTLVRRIGSERAGYGAVMYPIVALIISTIFEDYQWSLASLTGMALVIGGNGLVLLKRKKPSLVSEVEVERG